MGELSVGPFGDVERRFIDVLDRVSDAIVALDGDWRLVYVNEAAETHFGAPRDQMLGKVCWELFPETAESSVRLQYEQAVAQMTPVELETISPVTKRAVKQRLHPSPSGLTIYFRDLSAERQTAQRAERAMSLLADAGEELSLSLERDEIIRRLTSLVVP